MTFHNSFHEFLFVLTAVMGQFLMPFNLAATILPGGVIAAAIGASDLQIAWLTAAFAMGLGSFLLITGKIGDILGPKTIYAAGLLLHAAFSLVTGFTKDIRSFTIFRGLSGAALAMAIPTGVALLANAYEAGSMKRNKAFAVFAVTATAGFVSGCFNAAIFGQLVQWKWIFWVIAMISLTVAVSTHFVIPSALNVHSGSAKEFDFIGGATGVIGLLLITFAINQGASVGWHTVYVYVLFIVGLLTLFGFLFIEYKVANPVMPLNIWKSAAVTSVLVSLTMTFVGWGIFLLYTTIFIQSRGYTTVQVAVQWVPAIFSALFAVITTPIFMKMFGAHIVFPLGALIITIGHVIIALTPAVQTYWAQIFVAIIIAIPGSIWLPAGAQAVISNSVSQFEQGIAGSLVNVVTTLPVAWGLSCASVVQQRAMQNGSLVHGIHAAAWLGFSLTGTAFVLSLIMFNKLKEANERMTSASKPENPEKAPPIALTPV